MEIFNILQGSSEWHELRNSKIGASDAPVIMGVSPWRTIEELWREKLGLVERMPPTYFQQRGLMLENFARQYFYLITGYETYPSVYISSENEFMMASLDGVTKDEKLILEIKCPGKFDHETALSGKIPEKYYPQLQHQMYVTHLDVCHYLSFDGAEGPIIKVKRDDVYIEKMIEKEKKFYDCVQNLTWPGDI